MRTANMYIKLAIVLSVACISQCNNFNLLENMENPAGVNGPRIFVSSLKTAGNFNTGLASTGCSSNGYSDLICVCPYLAAKAGLSNASKFIPWLSENSVSARCALSGTFASTCATAARGSWYNMKKEPVALNAATLFSGTLLNAIRYTETGDDAGATPVYTGTASDGSPSGSHCGGGWTNPLSAVTGTLGFANRTDVGWTAANTAATCDTQAAIYCLETQ